MKDNKKWSEPKVLIIGPGRTVRGGITSVLLDYEKNDIWEKYFCKWLETYNDSGQVYKISAFIKSLVMAIWLIPRSHIVHIHAAHKTSFYRKTVFFLIAKLTGRKTILHLHAPYPNDFWKFPLNIVSRWVFHRADRVIALSKSWAEVIRELAPQAKIVVVANPGPAPKINATPAGQRRAIILYAGKLERRKGYDDLLRAMPRILNYVPKTKLIFAGHGEIEAAKYLTYQLSIYDNVEFVGWVRGDRKDELFRQARVFCLPSYGEGVPMALLEAMSSGTPSVVTPVGGIPDIIIHNNNGLLIEPGSVEQIAEAILSIMIDNVLANKLAVNALFTIKEKYSLDIISQQISELYDVVGAKNKAGQHKNAVEINRRKNMASV